MCIRIVSSTAAIGYVTVGPLMEVDRVRLRHPEGSELQSDVTAADWIAPRLLPQGRGAGTRVCSIVPAGYEKYVRVFHHTEELVGSTRERRRWSEVAERTGSTMHPTAQFTRFGWPERPSVGQLDRVEAALLIDVLREQTATPDDCGLAIWNGYGELTGAVGSLFLAKRGPWGWLRRRRQRRQRLDPPSGLADAPTVSLPNREYYLYKGSIDVVLRFEFMQGSLQTPNLWWPQDRAWIVGTGIDFDSTLVGCRSECASALLRSELEALEVSPENRLDIYGDEVNAG